FLFFFFSSRRRHTRCLSDWSSDVCSSDLVVRKLQIVKPGIRSAPGHQFRVCSAFSNLPVLQDENLVRAANCREAMRDYKRGSSKDRKSTRLNSSHLGISYAVFCLKKKNNR